MSSSKASRPSVRGIRAQLIFFTAGIFGLTLLAFSIFIYRVFTGSHEREFDADLLNYAVDVAYSLDVDFYGNVTLSPKFMNQSEKIFPFELGETLIDLRNGDGQILARSRRLKNAALPFDRESLTTLPARQAEFQLIERKDSVQMGLSAVRYRLINYYFQKDPASALIVQIAAPTRRLEADQRALLTFFGISIPFVLLVAILGGLYLSRKALAPVTLMIERTRKLSAEKLSERLPIPRARDEIQELALTLNGLLDRLEEAFRSQQTFVSDASHQLKTPLAILRGEIDLMRNRARSPEEIAQFLESASEEVGYLSRMLEDLLTLARIDTGTRALSLSSVRVDETLLDVVAKLDRLAAPKHVDLIVDLNMHESANYCVQGDADLIRGLFECIIENAIKYSRTGGGRVEISLREEAERVEIDVRDEGIGIPPADLPKIFDRFHRSDLARSRFPGSGLGLAIAKRIIEVHQGSITAESDPDRGTCVRISLHKSIPASA